VKDDEHAVGASRPMEPQLEVVKERIAALDRHFTSEFSSLKELLQSQRAADALAVTTALEAAQELAQKHNDLIRQMERKDATYATQVELDRIATWQARLGGGLLVVGFIGIANLAKIWTG
jgi:hypothetical protein